MLDALAKFISSFYHYFGLPLVHLAYVRWAKKLHCVTSAFFGPWIDAADLAPSQRERVVGAFCA